MKNIITIFLGIICSVSLMGQAAFINSGKIEYERKMNLHRQFESEEEEGSSWWKEFIKKQPHFVNSYFNLSFNADKSIYEPGKESDVQVDDWMSGPAKQNSVLTDFKAEHYTSRRRVFEQTFIVSDSTNKVHWKLSNEVRTIAGFECRKAVGVISDSVYVVAFYTEEIPVSGGPESFGGLPGMILGLAVPRLYTTWFATRVELMEPPAAVFTINEKGKKITADQMAPTLKTSFKDWGKRGEKFVWWSLL